MCEPIEKRPAFAGITRFFFGSWLECFVKSRIKYATFQGGIREALFSKNYELLWNERIGFAKIAKEAHVVHIWIFKDFYQQRKFNLQIRLYLKPILPVFTENGQQITYIPGLRSQYLSFAYILLFKYSVS
jgi:hypothetical protein